MPHRTQKRQSGAVNDKRGDMPRHYKHSHSTTQYKHAEEADFTLILRCQKQ